MNEPHPNLTMTVLNFLLQNLHACIELTFVKRVLPLTVIEAVPSSPNYLVGVMNLAGKSIPVIDLSLRLGMSRSQPYDLNQPILLCFDGYQQVGIVVDEIIGLQDIEKSTMQLHDEFTKDNSAFLAIIPGQQDLSLLLNIKSILAIDLTASEIKLSIDETLLNKAKKHHG